MPPQGPPPGAPPMDPNAMPPVADPNAGQPPMDPLLMQMNQIIGQLPPGMFEQLLAAPVEALVQAAQQGQIPPEAVQLIMHLRQGAGQMPEAQPQGNGPDDGMGNQPAGAAGGPPPEAALDKASRAKLVAEAGDMIKLCRMSGLPENKATEIAENFITERLHKVARAQRSTPLQKLAMIIRRNTGK